MDDNSKEPSLRKKVGVILMIVGLYFLTAMGYAPRAEGTGLFSSRARIILFAFGIIGILMIFAGAWMYFRKDK